MNQQRKTNRAKAIWKSSLWEELWEIKCLAIEKANMYEFVSRRVLRKKEVIEYAVLFCTAIATIGNSLEMNEVTVTKVLAVVFGSLATLLSGFILTKRWDSMIQRSSLAVEHLQFLQNEIEKCMMYPRSCMEYNLICEVMNSFLSYFDRAQAIVSDSIREKYMFRFRAQTPLMPNVAFQLTPGVAEYEKVVQMPPALTTATLEGLFVMTTHWGDLRAEDIRTRTLFSVDNEGFIVDADATYSEIFQARLLPGQRNEQAYPFHWISSIHSEDALRIMNQWFEAVSKRRLFLNTFRIVRAASIGYIVCEATPCFDLIGQFEGMKALCLEVSQEAWRRLRVSEMHDIMAACAYSPVKIREYFAQLLKMQEPPTPLQLSEGADHSRWSAPQEAYGDSQMKGSLEEIELTRFD